MLKSILVLPDGRELTSGAEAELPLMSVSLTESVNDHEELTMGAVFANILEARVNTYEKTLNLTAGDEVVLYREDDRGQRHRIGVFILEKPTRPTSETMELRGYDRVIGLNRDLTAWLSGLDGWPYRLTDFAGMVCEACGLELVSETVPNGDFLVQAFTAEVTGYQLMRWIGEVCCRFCRANPEGEIELAWYTPAGVSITPSGDSYYLQNSLSYEAYEVAPVDAVQIRLAEHASGALWPQVLEGANSYIIESNPILRARVTEDLLPVLENIRQALPSVPYRPFRVSIPATLDIHAGNTVQIIDKNGVTFTSLVMSREQVGQKDTLECTGSPRRDSAVARNEMTEQEKTATMKDYADSAAGAAESAANLYTNQKALQVQTSAAQYADDLDRRLDQTGIFNRLTSDGTCQGLFMQDGQLYINASYIKSGIIDAALVQVINLIAEQLKSVKDTSTLSITGAALKMLSGNNRSVWLNNEFADESNAFPIMYMSDYRDGENTDNAEFSPHHIKIGGTSLFPIFEVYASTSYVGEDIEKNSEMHVDSINPGKKVLYSGAVSVGSTFTVPKTSYYDLFAIKLQDSNGGNSPVVLAYKYGNTIYGVGGWCGTETLYKELYFVSATFSGNTWTLVDAGLHDVYESGGLSDSTRLQLKEVIGVI